MSNTIKKTIRLNVEIASLIDAYREHSKSSFSEAMENLLLKGLENVNVINSLKQLFKDEMKIIREEVKNQGNRLAGLNINHFKFNGRIYAHTFSMYKTLSQLKDEEISQIEKNGISRALQDLKQKNDGELQ